MSVLEKLSSPESVYVPPCRCGQELRLARIEASELTAERRVFQGESCGHQLTLTVWKAETA
jgi:hypothetical protein